MVTPRDRLRRFLITEPASRPRPVSVLIAPDKFKGTLTNTEAAAAMAQGVRRVAPDARVVLVPVADGGEGTVDAIATSGGRRCTAVVRGPLRDEVTAAFAVRGRVAYVEAAEAAGLHHVRPSPRTSLEAHSHGVGELLGAALVEDVDTVVVGLGGSACTDGGLGMATALGVVAVDSRGARLEEGGRALADLARIDVSGLDPRAREVEVVAACDVSNPLVGESGAARVFGPQKGAGEAEISLLEQGLERYAEVVARATGVDVAHRPGAGAAGGLGAGLIAFVGATVTSGVDLVLDALDLDRLAAGVDLVITGEGCLDGQTLSGKAPLGVARLAARHGVDVLAVAGRIDLAPAELSRAGFAGARSLVEDVGPERARTGAAEALAQATARVTSSWLREQS